MRIINVSARHRRIAIAVGDQLLSSLTNFIGTIVAARLLISADLGRFSLVGALYVILLVAARGVVNEPLTIVRNRSAGPIDGDMGSAAGASLLVGVIAAASVVGFGLILHSELTASLFFLSLVLPALFFQDFLRFAAVALGRPDRALALDAIWFCLQLGASGALIWWMPHSVVFALAAWLVPGAAAGLVGALLLPVRPDLAGASRWLASNATLGVRFAASNVLGQNTGIVLVFVLGILASPAQVAYFRVAQVALAPPAQLNAGARFALIPELVRFRNARIAVFRRLVTGAAVFLAATITGWGALVWLFPSIGLVAFGSSWRVAHGLIPATTVAVATGGVVMAAMSGIRALGDARGTLRTTTVTASLNLFVGTIGAAFGGAAGATYALAAMAPITTALWWLQLRQSTKAYVTYAATVAPEAVVDEQSATIGLNGAPGPAATSTN